MAASLFALATICTTDAQFRAWGSAVAAAMLAGGWTKVENNVDWTTATCPTVAASMPYYEIWSSNDAGGGLASFRVKLEYGVNSGATKGFAMAATAGWTSDGAGNLTGTVSTRITQGAAVVAGDATVISNIVNARSGGLLIVFSYNANAGAGTQMCVVIERTRTTAGAYQNELIFSVEYRASGGNAYFLQVLNQTTAYGAETTSATYLQSGVNVSQTVANMVSAGNAGICYFTGFKGKRTSPSIMKLACGTLSGTTTGTIGNTGDTVPVPFMGVTRNYKVGFAAQAPCGWQNSPSYNPLYLID